MQRTKTILWLASKPEQDRCPGPDYTVMIRDLIKKHTDSPLPATLDDHLRRLHILYRLARIYTDQEHRAVWDGVIAEATD